MNRFIYTCFLAIILSNVNAQWTVPKEVTNTTISSMAIYGGSLYVAGGFQWHTKYNGYNAVNMVGIGKFNGNTFDSVSTGLNGQGAALVVYNSKLIVAGAFSLAGGIPANNIASWNGTVFDSLGGGISGITIYCLAVYHNELYVGGKINKAGNTNVKNIAKWNGSSWSSVGGGISNQVWSLEVYNDELYASGYIDTAGTVPVKNIARWNGVKLDSVGSGLVGPATSLKTYKNELYSTSSSGTSFNYIARWNGTNWSNLAGGLSGGSSVTNFGYGLEIYNNDLIVCGQFNKADTVSAFNIAKWDGTKWGKLGLGNEINYGWGEFTTISYPYNGDLYVSGLINRLANDTCYFFARYHDASIGIQEFDFLNYDVKIYPNPSIGNFIISSELNLSDSNVLLYNLIGKEIKNTAVIKGNEIEIKTEDLIPGIYFIKINNKSGFSKTQKIVIEN